MAYVGPRLVCDHCRRELLHEQDVIENEAGVFHRGECYLTAVTVCDACLDPILADIVSNDSGDFHPVCYEDLVDRERREAMGVRDVVLIGEVVDNLIERLDEGRDRARGK